MKFSLNDSQAWTTCKYTRFQRIEKKKKTDWYKVAFLWTATVTNKMCLWITMTPGGGVFRGHRVKVRYWFPRKLFDPSNIRTAPCMYRSKVYAISVCREHTGKDTDGRTNRLESVSWVHTGLWRHPRCRFCSLLSCYLQCILYRCFSFLYVRYRLKPHSFSPVFRKCHLLRAFFTGYTITFNFIY